MREIRKRNREGEVEMQVTVVVKELKRGNWRSMRGEEWKAQDGLILFRDRIYIPKNAELRRRIVANTTTPTSPDTRDDGRHSNSSPDPTGGHKCRDT
jgi:hypothetical protein